MKKNIKNLPVKYTLYFFMLVLTGSWCDSKEVAPCKNSGGNTNSITTSSKTTEQQKNNAPGTGSTAKENGNTGKPAGTGGTGGREAEKEKEAGPREGEGQGSEVKEAEPGMGSAATRLETGSEREEKTEGEEELEEGGEDDDDKNEEETKKTEERITYTEEKITYEAIDFTTYLKGLEELEKNMVQKHSELREAFTYFKAIQQLVLRLASNQENFIQSIIGTSGNLNEQGMEKIKKWQEIRKTKLSKVISSLQAFYNDAIEHMNIIQQIVEKAKNYKNEADNQTKNILQTVNNTINVSFGFILMIYRNIILLKISWFVNICTCLTSILAMLINILYIIR